VDYLQKKRQLILTDFPRFIYVDPSNMEIKGTIDWHDTIQCVPKVGNKFEIIVPGRKYLIEDQSYTVDSWCENIQKLKK